MVEPSVYQRIKIWLSRLYRILTHYETMQSTPPIKENALMMHEPRANAVSQRFKEIIAPQSARSMP